LFCSVAIGIGFIEGRYYGEEEEEEEVRGIQPIIS
jgi:hypothetical protein